MDACVKSATLSGVDSRMLEVTAVAEPGLPWSRMGEIR